MGKAFTVFGRAIACWWKEFFLLLGLNIAWLALQLPLVTGPPATAALYAVARMVVDGEIISWEDIRKAARSMLWPAWKWGVVNLLVLGVLAINFLAYSDRVGLPWSALRTIWGSVAVAWMAVNLFYWPFWLAQEERSMRTTLRNSALFLMKNPSFGLTLVVLWAAFALASVLLTLPLSTILMSWTALAGVLAVDEALA